MENEGVLSENSMKKEQLDEDNLGGTDCSESNGMVKLEQIQVTPKQGNEDTDFKMETESILDKCFVKEEPDADSLQSNYLEENGELKNEYEAKTYKWDPIWNEAEQNTEELHNAVLDERYVEVKLETASDKEVNEDEIDEPDFVSLEDFNATLDVDYCMKKQPLEIANPSDSYQAKPKKFKCEKCEYQTNYRNNFIRHMERHKDRSERKLFDCATCGRTFFTIRALEQHTVVHLDPEDQPTYECDLCEYKSIHKYRLNEHKLKHVMPEPAKSKVTPNNLKYKCEECSFQTDLSAGFRKHKETHLARSDRPLFECPTCDRTYTAKPYLKQHMLLHLDPKDRPTYDCDLCDYKTTYKANIKQHKLRHAKRIAEFRVKQDIYRCDKCSYQTEDNSCFRKHERTHKARSDRELFECATCSRSYFSKSHLKQHMLLHMDPKDRPTHDCDMCSFKTLYKSMIKKHKLRHATQVKPECGTQKKTKKPQA